MRSESESEDQCSQELSKSDDDAPNFHKKSKIPYTRNELVSLSELDGCKRLPSGLDQSILGELSICSIGLLHSCHDSESDMFHGYLPLHFCPNRECGLLGSGASLKVSSCVSGDSDPLVKGSGYHPLNRSNEAYRPLHLCKEKVQSKSENEDLYNNETFGSSEHLSHETPDERRRRESFEQMRNEQCKASQEKQSKICDKHKENLDPDIGLPMEASGTCKRFINKYNESEESAISRAEARDPAEQAFTSQTSLSTILLPSVLESRSLTKSLTGTFISEPCVTKRDHVRGYGLHSSGSDDQYLGEKKPAGGISSGYVNEGFEVYAPQNEEVTKKNSTNLPSGRNELVQNLMASTTSSAIDEISEKLRNWNKQKANPLILPHEYFEPSVMPDLNEHYSTNHHSVKCWSTNHKKGVHPTSSADHGASQPLSLEKNGQRLTDADTSSKLNRESFCFSEIEGSAKDLQTTESPGIQRDSVGMLTRNDLLKSHRFPFPCGHKNYMIPSKVNVSGSIKKNCEGIMSSSCTKQTVESKIEKNLSISDNTQAKIVNLRREPEGKLSPVGGLYEDVDSIDGLCLPDEDSLIMADDCILPQLESTSISAGRLFKANLLTSSSQVDVADKQAALSPFLDDKRSTQLGLEGPVFDSYGTMGSVTSYGNLHTQQYFPQFGHYQMNPGRVNFNSSDAQQVQMRSSNSKTNLYAPQPLQPFPSNMLADHFHHPHPDLRRFGHPTNSPLPQQMPIPINFPHHQVHRLTRGSPSPRPIIGMTSYAQELYPPHYFPYHDQRQNYGGFRMPNSVGKPFQMEVRSRQMHPLAMAGRGSGNFGKQTDTRFWYGQ